MSEKFQMHTVQNIIGYNFKNPSLLVNAFTHLSAADRPEDSNVGLCFLGKAVCELLIRDYLFSNFMKLENVNVSVADAETRIPKLMRKISDCNGLTEYMLLSSSASALRMSHTVESELFLALTGAIYKDGGMPSVRAYVLPKLRAVISDDDPALMREAKKSIIKKAENERDIFSDNSDTKERRSATNAIKNLFSSKKRKNDSADVAPIDEENAQSPTLSRGRRDTIIATSPTAPSTDVKHAGRTKQPSPAQVAAEHNGSRKEPEDGNYKSALQEYVQKNVRSATVMLEYKDTKSNGGCITEIYLFGRKIAKADGANKKESSQNAAKAAYHAITASSGDTAEWFKKIKNNPDTVVNVSATPTEPDYISELNRIYQKKLHRSNAAIKYVSAEAKTKGLLAYAVVADDERLGFGKGKTAREAKQNAAKNALEALEKNDNINFRKSK